MPMNLPENSENDGATLKYHDYTDTKISCSIAVAFVDSKLFFFADRSCFFFGDCTMNIDSYGDGYFFMDPNARNTFPVSR